MAKKKLKSKIKSRTRLRNSKGNKPSNMERGAADRTAKHVRRLQASSHDENE